LTTAVRREILEMVPLLTIAVRREILEMVPLLTTAVRRPGDGSTVDNCSKEAWRWFYC
jgi:hypothetical protein